MISCHLLLGEPWYKEHDVTYDCKTHRYTIKKGKKCSLVPMGVERFISWRKEHLEKIKEQEEEEKKVEVAEIFAVVIQSSEEEVNSKPKTVSMQGGEDDMTNTKFICINDHHDVEDVGLCQVMAASLDNRMHPNQENIKVQPESTVGVVPKYGMHAMEGKNSFTCTSEGLQQLDCLFMLSRAEQDPAVCVREIYFIETKQRILISYYFSRSRPPEQAYASMFDRWKLLSLRDIGWGPPNNLYLIILVFNV